MSWPTPSKLALAELCAYPWHRLAPPWREVRGDGATFGSAFHRAIQCAVVVGVSEALLEQIAAAYRLTPAEETQLLACVEHGVDLLEMTAPDYRAAEVSILYDVARDTARVLPEALEAGAIPEGCIHGTIDLVEAWDGGLCISDWKTGGRSGELDPRTDPQLRTYALMAARAFGRDVVTVSILHVGEGGIEADNAHLDAFDLACARTALRSTLARVDAGGPPTSGRHCRTRYCPIVAECPATQRALAEVTASVEAQLPMVLSIESPEQAARVRHGIQAAEKALEQYRAALHEYVATHGPIEVAPGVLYGRIERPGNERIDAEVPGAVAAVRELLGETAADLALEVSTSFTAIERAARARAKELGDTGRGSIKRYSEPVYDRLRELGAIKQGAPSVRFDEITTKKEGRAA